MMRSSEVTEVTGVQNRSIRARGAGEAGRNFLLSFSFFLLSSDS
jgi:hypothetical protein